MLLEMAETSTDLLDECWATIFNRGSDWESLSLVCKRFLSITNEIRVSLSVSNPSNQVLCKLLRRFPHLRKIQLCNYVGDLNEAILAISQSGLNLEELDLSQNKNLPTVCLEELGSNMKNLKVLDCSYSNLTDIDLVRIANSFPQLEELQITCSSCHKIKGKMADVTDEGIEFLSSKLKRLRKIDFSENRNISDKSLVYLSSNCEFLEQIRVGYHDAVTVTENGISFVIQNTPYLNSLLLRGRFMIRSFGFLHLHSANFPKNLQSLSFENIDISDEFLFSIAIAQIPLKEFNLSYCKSYTIAGISSVLNSSQLLKSLGLSQVGFLTNEHIEKFSRILPNLTSIRLFSCPKLSDSAFFKLTQRCHLLSHISMENTGLGKEEYNYDGLTKNLAINSLNLSSNRYLRSSNLGRILSSCPNVEELIFYNSFQREQQLEFTDILEHSRVIKRLVLDGTLNLNFCRNDIEISKLQNLSVSYSMINDELLTMIGRKCPGLTYLDLEDCGNVTEKGVKEVVKSCKGLNFLSLRACSNVTFDIIEWIVSTRPSLRRLFSPRYPEQKEQKYTWIMPTWRSFYRGEEEVEYSLLDGCVVYWDLRPSRFYFLSNMS